MVSVARTRKKEEKKPGREQTKKTAGKTSAPLKRHRPEAVEEESSALLDDSTKRDIAGISCIVLAVIFMLLVALPADGALVSSIASEWMHLIFGVGAYMLPFILAGIGATFLFRSQRQRASPSSSSPSSVSLPPSRLRLHWGWKMFSSSSWSPT